MVDYFRLFGEDAMGICSLSVDIIEQSFVDIAVEEDDGVITYLTTSKRFDDLTEISASDIYVLDVLEGSGYIDASPSQPPIIDGVRIRRLPLHEDVIGHSAKSIPLWQSASILLDAHMGNG